MCLDIRSQETCAQPIGEAPLAHPILDVRLINDMPMNSTVIIMRKMKMIHYILFHVDVAQLEINLDVELTFINE